MIKAVPAAVLVAIEDCAQIKRILVCTGGKHYIEDAVQLTGEIAKCIGASVTLLHVMAEPPAMYADLVRLEEDVDRLLESESELGVNLRGQKKSLEKIGVTAEVRVRHGIAIDQIFAELEEGHHDMIVVGSSLARGPLRHYIMGDVTRSVLIARPVLYWSRALAARLCSLRDFGIRSSAFLQRRERPAGAKSQLQIPNLQRIPSSKFQKQTRAHVWTSGYWSFAARTRACAPNRSR